MKQAELFDELRFVYGRELREQFKSGELPRIWRRDYPQLFNDKDLSLTAKGSNYLFFEWLGAVLLYEAGFPGCQWTPRIMKCRLTA